jgi:hypothetical protein
MKRLDLILKIEWILVIAMSVLFLSSVFCFAMNKSAEAVSLLKGIVVLAIFLFAAYIRASYLNDNLPKDVLDEKAKLAERKNYESALTYIVEEKFGHRSRFVRRFGDKTYEKFINHGLIVVTSSSKKEWKLTDKGCIEFNALESSTFA